MQASDTHYKGCAYNSGLGSKRGGKGSVIMAVICLVLGGCCAALCSTAFQHALLHMLVAREDWVHACSHKVAFCVASMP